MSSDNSPNRCQHPECHNSRIAFYAGGGTNGFGWPETLYMSLDPKSAGAWRYMPWRRWCHTHALMNERGAFGSAS